MKKILLLLGLCLHLLANDILVFNNEYQVVPLQKKLKKVIVGNRDTINVSLLNSHGSKGSMLKIFGKKSGNTSILLIYRDNSIENYHVYVNENLGYIQKMINIIEPNLTLSKVGNGSTVINGVFDNPHNKSRIYEILQKGGIDTEKLMDLTKTKKVNKMIRTKLYLIAVNNQRAKDLGGVTGLSFFSQYINASINPTAANSVTFSGFLLNNLGNFTKQTGHSTLGTLNFLQKKGIASILDDTVLITTEDKNATFRVGGELFIPTGITQNIGTAPTIQVTPHEYGLKLTLTTKFMQKDGYMHINVHINDSNIDPDESHNVALGDGIYIPAFISKNIQTNVVVQSKQVIALGGRLHGENAQTEEKVPFFGDIPLIGELFKHKVNHISKTDLIFLLVPEIVDANENIDDTHFYEDFKDSSNAFHAQILDENRSTNTTKTPVVAKDPLSSVETTVKPVEEKSSTFEPIIIEEEAINEQNSSTHEIPAVSKALKETQNKTVDEAAKKDVLATQSTQESTDTTPQMKQTQTALQTYKVTAHTIYVRDEPINGKAVSIWKKGHKFTSDESKFIDSKVWLKIKQDCISECKDVNGTLWISQRYTEKI